MAHQSYETWDGTRGQVGGTLLTTAFICFFILVKCLLNSRPSPCKNKQYIDINRTWRYMLICILSHTALANTNMAFFIICIVLGKALMATRNFTILWCLNNICTSIANYIFNPIAINTCTYPCSWFKVQF